MYPEDALVISNFLNNHWPRRHTKTARENRKNASENCGPMNALNYWCSLRQATSVHESKASVAAQTFGTCDAAPTSLLCGI